MQSTLILQGSPPSSAPHIPELSLDNLSVFFTDRGILNTRILLSNRTRAMTVLFPSSHSTPKERQHHRKRITHTYVTSKVLRVILDISYSLLDYSNGNLQNNSLRPHQCGCSVGLDFRVSIETDEDENVFRKRTVVLT